MFYKCVLVSIGRIFNIRRACAARVTVLCLPVCLRVFLCLFLQYRLEGSL